MKIGIITYWQASDNYGQLLQCYALQTYLKSLGHDAFLIRYDFANRKVAKSKWKRILKMLLIYPVIKRIFNRNSKKIERLQLDELNAKNRTRNFDSFREVFIEKSKVLYHSLAELQKNPPIADVYITGSDQVWSQLLDLRENEVFFLNFGDKSVKRVSYAASFGMSEYPQKLMRKLKDNLYRFDSVSVREIDGIHICAKAGTTAQVVVDPTVLLLADSYKNMSVKYHKKDDYVFVYSLNVSSSDDMYFSVIKEYAKDKHLNIVVTPASGCLPGLELFGEDVDYEYATIQEWLANIDCAHLVVTTSFHGIVFSILMHTPFVYVPLQGNLAKMNNRAFSLLTSIGLSSRIVYKKADVRNVISNSIDWHVVDKLVNKSRQKSFEFIKDILKNESSI